MFVNTISLVAFLGFICSRFRLHLWLSECLFSEHPKLLISRSVLAHRGLKLKMFLYWCVGLLASLSKQPIRHALGSFSLSLSDKIQANPRTLFLVLKCSQYRQCREFTGILQDCWPVWPWITQTICCSTQSEFAMRLDIRSDFPA